MKNRLKFSPIDALRGDREAASIPDALINYDQLPDSANIRLPIVMGILGVSAPTVWRWAKAGKIPQPRKLSAGVTVWNVGALRQSLAAQ